MIWPGDKALSGAAVSQRVNFKSCDVVVELLDLTIHDEIP